MTVWPCEKPCETVTFNASGFSQGQTVTAVYANPLYSYEATCTVAAGGALSCLTAPGVGADLKWTLTDAFSVAVPILTPLISSYAAPLVTSAFFFVRDIEARDSKAAFAKRLAESVFDVA